jgi:hypothetical protein
MVNNAQSLFELKIILDSQAVLRDQSGLEALANALREHPCLQEFRWFNSGTLSETAPRVLSLCGPGIASVSPTWNGDHHDHIR